GRACGWLVPVLKSGLNCMPFGWRLSIWPVGVWKFITWPVCIGPLNLPMFCIGMLCMTLGGWKPPPLGPLLGLGPALAVAVATRARIVADSRVVFIIISVFRGPRAWHRLFPSIPLTCLLARLGICDAGRRP